MNEQILNISDTDQGKYREEYSPRSILLAGISLIIGMLTIAYLHYNTPNIISVIIQIAILSSFFFSKKNYPWLFILCFIHFQPGGLFCEQARQMILIENPGLGVVTFEMMFVLVAWLKVLKNKPIKVFYQNRFILVVLYILLLVPVFGVKWVSLIKSMILFSWLLLIPRLLSNKEEIDSLFYLLFMVNIFVFISNIYKFTTGQAIVSLFTHISDAKSIDTSEILIRTAEGIQFAHLSVIGGLYYLSKEKSSISFIIAYSGLILGLLSIIFSATRGWIISTTFLIITYSFFMLPKLFKNIIIIIPVLVLTIIIIWQVPIINKQITKAYERTLYYENILNPDLNAETTDIGRIRRSGRVLEKFRESPWVGWGFGETGREYSDSHTGNQSILLNMGIFGYLIMLFFWGGFIYTLLASSNLFHPTNPDYKLKILIILSFISVFIIHSTSGAFLHPTIGADATIWYGLIFSLGNYLYYQGKGVFD